MARILDVNCGSGGVAVLEARRQVGVGRDVMRRLIAIGEIGSFKVGNGGVTSRRMVPVSELHAWMAREVARQRTPGGPDAPPDVLPPMEVS
jgi:hypothetical protein